MTLVCGSIELYGSICPLRAMLRAMDLQIGHFVSVNPRLIFCVNFSCNEMFTYGMIRLF